MISVFGGTGFIGGSFVQQFSDECVVVPRDSRKPLSDDVLYFISTTDNYGVLSNPRRDVDVNLAILCDVLWECKKRGNCTFNFISSWFVYGETELPAREDSQCNPKGFYSITKKCAEDLVKSFCDCHGIPYRILRLCNVYGSGDEGVSSKKNALQFLTDKLSLNEEVSLHHAGNFVRDYLHVTDVCSAIKTVLDNAGTNEVINIGSGEKHTFKYLIDISKNYMESSSPVTIMEVTGFQESIQVKDMWLDVSKLTALGFKPKVSIEDGLKELCLQLKIK
tara:strand:+ start:3459 stop:4292 length:834 start_codon:yes stop_codon:yes gene_type:complete